MIPGSYYPRSFTILVIVAMSVLTVPLASGVINAVRALDRVADAQRQFTRDSLATTRDVRYIAGSVSQLQRASGQYHLLQDAEFGPPLATRFAELETRMARVAERLPDAPSRAALVSLEGHVAALYRQVRPGGTFLDSARFNALDPAFDTLHADARTLVNRADAGVQRELLALEATVHDTRERLIVLALALIPLTLLLAGVFSWMISRPIKQLRGAIQQLGQGDLRPGARINGPQDIVELGRELDWLRQRLEALEAQKLRFLRHVSHELKTPLASLREGVALLGDELAGTLNARQRTIVGIMDSGSRVLQRRIEDLIRYGGMARGPHPAEPLPLAEVVSRVVEAQRLALDARHIEVESQLDAASIRADRSHVETVLDNLLSNAVKFSPDGRRILIRSEPVGDAVAVSVCDQGPGIAAADRERIFEPFFQGADQPATTVKGSGLGLSIVREAVLAANGSVEIVERAPWATCFRVTWPNPQ